ncbi:MAG TPA: integrase core domain-containing protein [Candidatus Cloacimonadota bacterium]|nr:integrase core domain-containing protein [Candidatus Cloacimonadota bacterium]
MHSRDNFTRKLIHRVADTSISGIRVAGERTDIAKYHNLPEFIVCGNCSEFRSSVMFKWYQDNKVDLSFIASGKPQQNAYLESFTGKFRKEYLDLNCFGDLLK